MPMKLNWALVLVDPLTTLAVHHQCTRILYVFPSKLGKVLPRFELGSLDSKSRVLTITP